MRLIKPVDVVPTRGPIERAARAVVIGAVTLALALFFLGVVVLVST